MNDIIDLTAERNRREAPDAEHVRSDEFGRPLYEFTCSYDFDGAQYGFHLWAYDHEDAAAKIDAIRASARVDGQVYGIVPA